MIRAVLDTNVVISALLFSGPPSQLVSAWQSSRLRPVVSAPILDEYIRVLAYPKFELTTTEIRSLIGEELLPLH
ncbi:MAG: putative toxin-antitoxin system toxin component, PIN family [Nitrospira sp.]|nr:putative toxin-antitoxin system toxin component, PIN family [Nitrospira sp.]